MKPTTPSQQDCQLLSKTYGGAAIIMRATTIDDIFFYMSKQIKTLCI